MIHIDPTLSSLYRHDDGVDSLEPAPPPAPTPIRFPAEARAYWKKNGKEEGAAGQALLDLGLHAPAAPHLQTAYQAALDTLSVYFWNEPGKKELPPNPDPVEQSSWNTVAGWDPLTPGDVIALLDVMEK